MADHNTLIGGAGDGIEEGTVLVEGVAYKLESGRTRIDGVAKDIVFATPEPEIATVKLSGSMSNSSAYVTIDGTKHYTAKTLSVEIPKEISVYIGAVGASTAYGSWIKHNGVTVLDGKKGTYEFTLESKSATIAFTSSQSSNGNITYYQATITTA